jgi:predicted DNA-binding transcriptional regulator AlpA
LLRKRAVARWLGITPKTLAGWVKDGHFPEPLRLSARLLCWRRSVVLAWLAQQEQAASAREEARRDS